MTPHGARLVGYLRVSTAQQAMSGLGIEAQRAAVNAAVGSHGWELVAEHVDAGESGGKASRPALDAAILDLEEGRADGLIVAKLDRLMRSRRAFDELCERFVKEGWHLIALDFGVDTTTPMGRAMLSFVATINQLEREMAAERTREALAAKKAQGVRLGRKRGETSDAIRARAVELQGQGMGPSAIARVLTEEYGRGPGGGVITRHRVYDWLRGEAA